MSMYIKHFLYNHVSFLIMHDGYPVKTMKKQRECSIVFSGNTGFREDNREKRKGNKNFKVPFSLFLFLPIYNIMNSFPVIYCTRKPVYFFV